LFNLRLEACGDRWFNRGLGIVHELSHGSCGERVR
jgi:hypothetical protein